MTHKPVFKIAPVVVGILMLALSSSTVSAQTYRWVDPATGRVTYSDLPPPGNATQVSKTAKPAANSQQDIPYATQQAMKVFPVTLYTGPDCAPCAEARELLTARGTPFTERILREPADHEELKALVGDVFIPSLKVGKQSIRGFEASSYNSMLDLAGYPSLPGSTKNKAGTPTP